MAGQDGKPDARRRRLGPAERRAAIEDAARTCIARGGIRAFTVDQVVAEAGVSRGLIAHHFGSMDGLLVAVYRRMYGEWLAALAAPQPGMDRPDMARLATLIDALLSPALFAPDGLRVWLALWAEAAANPILRDEHGRQLDGYRALVEAAVGDAARARGATVDIPALARALVCLIDGFAVQRCVDPARMTEDDARTACRALLGPLMA